MLVQKYAAEFSNYFYTTASTFNDRTLQKFALVNEDSLWNLGTVPVGEVKRRSVGEFDKFTSVQWMPVNDTNSLMLHLMKYKVYEPEQTSLGLPYLKMYTPYVIAKHIADTLLMPVNRFILISRNSNTTSFSADQFNNVLDITGIHKLGANDTLLIQRFDVALIKEK